MLPRRSEAPRAPELRRLREDAGVSKSGVAKRAGIDRKHVDHVEAGRRGVSLEAINRVAAALEADLSVRVFPNTGPRIRDRFQAPIVEALLRCVGPGWDCHPEVVVRRPVRGVIDLVLAAQAVGRIVAVEIHSEVRRVEQQIRWAAEKSEALPSSAIWPALAPGGGATPPALRLLVLRSTGTTWELTRQFGQTLAAAYPADPAAVIRALEDPLQPWPGHGLLWARVEAGVARILPGMPRGMAPQR